MVKHFPSTAISCTETASYATHISHVSSADSRYECSDPTSHFLKDIHIVSPYLCHILPILKQCSFGWSFCARTLAVTILFLICLPYAVCLLHDNDFARVAL